MKRGEEGGRLREGEYRELSAERLAGLLRRMEDRRILVVGDACLDVYWEADMTRSQLSLETPHFPLPVVRERFSPGGGSNTAANLAALGVRTSMLTVLGEDWRGRELTEAARKKGVDFSPAVTSDERVTPAYCKPLRQGISEVVYEDPRLDFENYETLPPDLEREICQKLERGADGFHAVVVMDQLRYGVVASGVRKALSGLAGDHLVTGDSRHHVTDFTGVILKPNALEVLRALDAKGDPEDRSLDELAAAGLALGERTAAPVLMTLSSRGALWLDGENDSLHIPAVAPGGEIDPVGAGDTYLAAFTAARAAGADAREAMIVAGLAASVVIEKIGMTGTASPGEIMDRLSGLGGV